MALIATTSFDIFKKGQTEPITIEIRNPTNQDLVNPSTNSTFKLIDISDDSVKDSETFAPTGGTKVTRIDTGIFQYQFDASTYPNEYLASFRCPLSSDVINIDVYVKSVSAKHFVYASVLKSQVDKARKSVYDDIENMDNLDGPAIRLFYGYDTPHLIFYLERGMQYINAVPPYTAMGVDNYPFNQYGSILIDAGTIAALEAQGIFAIDTDYNYSLGGNSLVIDHYSKLSTALSALITRFDKSVTAFKQMFRSKGTVLYQFLPGGMRAQRMLAAMPSGWWSRLLSGMGT